MADNRGLYFLANDRVLDRAVAFLNSVRRFNPDIPVCLIPFADDCTEVMRLRDRFDFTVFHDDAVLTACDGISRRFHGDVWGHYRKLAIWEGPYEDFVYVDTDTVVLGNLDFVFRHLDTYGFVVTHSNMAITRKWVWRNSAYGAGALSAEQIDFGASTGFICSRRGHLSLEHAIRRIPAALRLAPHMELLCYEQPLLNYLMVTSGLPYTSLYAMAQESGASDIPLERHSSEPIDVVRDGRIIEPQSPPTLLVHWAGDWQNLATTPGAQLPHQELWEYYRWRC